MNRTVLVAASLVMAGCAPESTDHEGHHHHAPGSPAADELIVRTTPAAPKAGEPVTLHLMVHTAAGDMVREFETVHERSVHLIAVRDGLDEFAHLHPDVDDRGNLTVTHTFPAAGTYRLFADYRPAGRGSAVARAEIRVDGPAVPAPPLVVNVPGRVTADGLTADVIVTREEFRFALTDSGHPVPDLRPYLGGLGHLVLVSADGRRYLHAHPAGEDAARGRLAFAVHGAEPGTYKGWLQVRRADRVHTLPFVTRIL